MEQLQTRFNVTFSERESIRPFKGKPGDIMQSRLSSTSRLLFLLYILHSSSYMYSPLYSSYFILYPLLYILHPSFSPLYSLSFILHPKYTHPLLYILHPICTRNSSLILMTNSHTIFLIFTLFWFNIISIILITDLAIGLHITEARVTDN